jgi:hypothetical protein
MIKAKAKGILLVAPVPNLLEKAPLDVLYWVIQVVDHGPRLQC